jgi:hypothetical protein
VGGEFKHMIKPAFSARLRLVYLTALCGAVATAGCMRSGPQKSAQSYTEDVQIGNYPAAYQLLSHRDQLDRTMEQFLQNPPLTPEVNRDWFKAVLRATNFEIGESKTEGDKANVTVKVTRPDLALWERTIFASLGPNDAANSVAQKQITEKTYPKITYDDNVAVIKQGDDWKIFVDFPARDNINKMRRDAMDAFRKYDYDKAISTYQSAIAELDKEEATGNAGLKFLCNRELQTIQNIKNQMPEAQAYISKLTIPEVDLKMAASRVPGIFGTITNGGDKGIDDLQVTVTYNEGKGNKKKQIYQEQHSIVTTPPDFGNFNRPVAPFVPGETRQFGFRLNAPADIQQKGTPDLNITQVVFTQSTAPLPKPPTPTPSPAASASPGAGASPGAAAPGGGASSPSLPSLPSPPRP